MNDESRVWIAERKCKSGKVSYHLRWVCPVAHKWKSRAAGPDGRRCTDRKRAEREAAVLEKSLATGEYSEIRKTTWEAFVTEHCERLAGESNRIEAERTLTEFGKESGNPEPRRVTFAMVESYVEKMKAKGNTVATVNKKLRYLRAAFNKAVRREYIARSPMAKWEWTREDDPEIRVANKAEEAALLAAAKELYGTRMESLIHAALGTGGRREELLGLTWDHVDLEAAEVVFVATKGKRDRPIPILPDLVEVLRKLHLQTQQEGGPFIGLGVKFDEHWTAIATKAKLIDKDGFPVMTLHDLRRSYITRLILAGTPLPTIQKLAGHKSITTTMRYYSKIARDDLRAGVEMLRKATAAG